MRLYLEPTGLWRDRQEEDGAFVEEPAPASSLYHIAAAWIQLREAEVKGKSSAREGAQAQPA